MARGSLTIHSAAEIRPLSFVCPKYFSRGLDSSMALGEQTPKVPEWTRGKSYSVDLMVATSELAFSPKAREHDAGAPLARTSR